MALNFIYAECRENRIGGELKTIRDNIKAQGSVAGLFIMLMLATIVALGVTLPVIDTAINGGGNNADGTIEFTANATVDRTINVSTETYTFVNTSATAKAAFNMALNGTTLEPSYACSRFVTEVNANSTLVSATSCSANTTTITSLAFGTAGNSYGFTSNVTGATVSAATLTSGANSATGNMSTGSLVLIGMIPLFLILSLLLLFIRPLL